MVVCLRVQFISGDNLFLTSSTASIIPFQLDFDRLRDINLPELSWSSNSYSSTSAFCCMLMFLSQVSSLFQIRSGASDLSSTGDLSAVTRALEKNDYSLLHKALLQTCNCLPWFSLSVLLLYHCPVMPFGMSRNLYNRCQDVELWSPLEAIKSQMDMALVSLLELALLWTAESLPTLNILQSWDASLASPSCTVNSQVTLHFYLFIWDKSGNSKVLGSNLACNMVRNILREEKLTASFAFWDASQPL